jgi:hypothetical protein
MEGAMRVGLWICTGLISFVNAVFLGVLIYALPASLSLGRGSRPGIEALTIEDAALQLRKRGASGFELMEQARILVGERMAYSRRNSFDSHRNAFKRGYGYCQQEAFALARLLEMLGFNAWPVHCEHCDFILMKNTGHAWVQVLYGGEIVDIDPRYMSEVGEPLLFDTRSAVRRYNTLFRLFAGWGSTAVNAYRYYKTGSDTDPW